MNDCGTSGGLRHRLAVVVPLVAVCLLCGIAARPAAAQTARFRVMTYNVENLFDTCHDAGRDDCEFLPDAVRRWTGQRYRFKLDRICRVLAAAGGDMPVDLVALCEVENDTVVRDLCERTLLNRLGYRYVVTDCPDPRGIDVALLYQPERFQPFVRSDIRLPLVPGERPLRDVLHVGGLLPTGDTLDVLVCHLPSRRGGTREAELRRRRSARALRRAADSIRACRCRPSLLLMGDFNDGSDCPSLSKSLGTRPVSDDMSSDTSALYVLSAGLKARDGIRGTYKYRGVWNMLDQIIAGGVLFDAQAPFRVRRGSCRIFVPAFLTEPDGVYGGVRPRRTYLGTAYVGGFSDHLPLILDFDMRIP